METTQYKAVDAGNRPAAFALMAMAVLITALGIGFGVYAVLNNVSFQVANAEIPGAVFAAVVAFLGIRYILATVKLVSRIKGRKFSWGNFKKIKKT